MEEQEKMDEVLYDPPLPFLREYFDDYPGLRFPPGNEVERRWQNRREGPDRAVMYCGTRWSEAEYTVKECGNVHQQLDIPETTDTVAVLRMLKR